MSSDIDRESERVREAYAHRAEQGLDARYDYWTPANLFIYQGRERVLLSLLREARMLPLRGRSILDVGCGDGAVLHHLINYGAEAVDLHGVDLLPERVERARGRLPGAKIEVGDAQRLPFDDASFDLVLGFTLLSSVIDDAARKRLAEEMARVTAPGGRIVLYDFRLNPTNRDARPLKRDEVRGLFPDALISFRGATLAPPIVRTLAPLPGGWLACSLLEVLPFLQTHFLAAVRPR